MVSCSLAAALLRVLSRCKSDRSTSQRSTCSNLDHWFPTNSATERSSDGMHLSILPSIDCDQSGEIEWCDCLGSPQQPSAFWGSYSGVALFRSVSMKWRWEIHSVSQRSICIVCLGQDTFLSPLSSHDWREEETVKDLMIISRWKIRDLFFKFWINAVQAIHKESSSECWCGGWKRKYRVLKKRLQQSTWVRQCKWLW